VVTVVTVVAVMTVMTVVTVTAVTLPVPLVTRLDVPLVAEAAARGNDVAEDCHWFSPFRGSD
jgi:hypothetical protein